MGTENLRKKRYVATELQHPRHFGAAHAAPNDLLQPHAERSEACRLEAVLDGWGGRRQKPGSRQRRGLDSLTPSAKAKLTLGLIVLILAQNFRKRNHFLHRSRCDAPEGSLFPSALLWDKVILLPRPAWDKAIGSWLFEQLAAGCASLPNSETRGKRWRSLFWQWVCEQAARRARLLTGRPVCSML